MRMMIAGSGCANQVSLERGDQKRRRKGVSKESSVQ